MTNNDDIDDNDDDNGGVYPPPINVDYLEFEPYHGSRSSPDGYVKGKLVLGPW
jgi:hypothetical protein